MNNLPQAELINNLVLLDNPTATDLEIIRRAFEDFGIELTIEDLDALYTLYLPDNFDNESKLRECYGTFSEF